MPKLVTDFVRVAKSGAAIDGRNIEASWLNDAAEQYSKDTYTAIITLEHYDPEWAGNYGTVEAMEARQEDGGVSLYAKLAPTEQLVRINRAGQKLFTSIKVHPNFAETGKAYVYQIGVTDRPASLGTEQLAFRASDGEEILPGVELSTLNFSSPEEQSLLSKIKALVSSAPTFTDSGDEDDDMKPEDLKALTDAIAAGFSSLKADLKPEQPEVKPESQPEEQPEAPATVSAEAFSTLKEEHEKLQTQFNALEQKLEQEVPPTEIDNAGGADDQGNKEKVGF